MCKFNVETDCVLGKTCFLAKVNPEMRLKMTKKINFLLPIFDSLVYLRIQVFTLKFAADSTVTVHHMLSNIPIEQCTAMLLWVSFMLTTGQKLSS